MASPTMMHILMKGLRAQLVAMIATIDAITLTMMGAEPEPELETPAGEGAEKTKCAHPDEARLNADTMGIEGAWVCGICNHNNPGTPIRREEVVDGDGSA